MKSIFIICFHIYFHCCSVGGMNMPIIDKNKAALRYGFQNMRDCHNYEKAFLCVTKCLDLHYDVARADKNCDCTCYHKKDKAKYTILDLAKSTKWRLGTPTTSKPVWAHSEKDPDTDLGVIEHLTNIQNLSSNEHEKDAGNITVDDVKVLSDVTDASDSVTISTFIEESSIHGLETENVENKTNPENQENTENIEKEENTESPDKNDNNENEKVTENAEKEENS